MKRTALAILISSCLFAALTTTISAQPAITQQEAHAIGVHAYLYFYSLVTMDLTRKQSTNIEPGKEVGKGPMNAFTNVSAYPPADYRTVVRVNFDTLYSVAWLDMTTEPMIVSMRCRAAWPSRATASSNSARCKNAASPISAATNGSIYSTCGRTITRRVSV